jgi:hypothetical protein
MEKSEICPFPRPKAVEINKGSKLPCSFTAQLRCSLVTIQVGTTRRGVQGGIVLNLHGRLGEAPYRDSGTEDAIPRCLQRFVRPLIHDF